MDSMELKLAELKQRREREDYLHEQHIADLQRMIDVLEYALAQRTA